MRNFIFLTALISGILMTLTAAHASSLETQARVNLVQRVEAQLITQSLPLTAGASSQDLMQLTLTGPDSYCVDVQLAPLPADATWSDATAGSPLALDSRHDADGSLVVELPLEQTQERPSRFVLSLTYE